MRNGVRVWWSTLLLVTVAWVLSDPDALTGTDVFAWRHAALQYSGLLAMAWMSIAMILATRPQWPERWFGGLDKMYRLHKWVGISAIVLSVVHWLSAHGPKWATAMGLLERGPRLPRVAPAHPIEQWLQTYRGAAELLGAWAFYAAILLGVVSVVRVIPYRVFLRSHRFFAIVYLALVCHAIVLTSFAYWTTPVALVIAPLLLWGTWAAALVLLHRVGTDRQARGTIASLVHYPGVHALDVTLDVPHGWRGHQPGQFAFVTSNAREGAHPYTMASAWTAESHRITFVVKALGDHTARLHDTLRIGQTVQVEGPYGCFTFDSPEPRQLWIGGGIGITPFIARMKYLAACSPRDARPIDLFHASADEDSAALAMLAADAAAAGVRLHVTIDARDGLLSVQRIQQAVPAWRDASVWYCGPAALGDVIRGGFARDGLDLGQRFHQELFAMR
jgi:predicted ferric reductase